MQQAVLKISLQQLQKNLQYFKGQTTAKLCGVVKADAYGHGAEVLAQHMQPYVDYFAVATVQEGIKLRLSGVQTTILVFTPPTTWQEVLQLLHYNLIATITDIQDYMLLQKVTVKENKVLLAHIKINTGMHRYGFTKESFAEFCQMQHSEYIQIDGIYSHFYCTKQRYRTQQQFTKFMRFAEQAEDTFGRLLKHICATGGFFLEDSYHLDMVRIGLGLYGYLPNGKKIAEVAPIMQLYAPVLATCNYTKGGMGYSTHIPKQNTLATVRIGYADGLQYSKSCTVPPCMDSQVLEGEYHKYQFIPLIPNFQEYADKHNTIVYQALTAFGNRVKRQYIFDVQNKDF